MNDKTFELQMLEWLEEEASLAPVLSDDERKLVDSLPKIDISDERL